MNQKQILGLLILGGAAAWYFSQQQPRYTGQFTSVPPPPPRNSPNYQVWVNSILQAFGQVAELWKPGGPFYKQPVPVPATGTTPTALNPAPGGIYGPNANALLFLMPGV